jgi:hypothetical protein
MNLLTKAEFAANCGKSKAAVSKALRDGRLDVYQDTGKINPGSPKSQKFAGTIGRGQKGVAIGVVGQASDPDPRTEKEFAEAAIKFANAQEQKTIEDAEFTKQKRIEKQMKNATRRGELLEADLVQKYLMTFLDRLLNTNKRVFSANYDAIVRDVLAAGEKPAGLKQSFLNAMEQAADDAKTKTVELLRKIQIEQGRK